MQIAYPDSFKNKSGEMIAATVNLWQMCFASDSADAVAAAVMAYISGNTSRFSPTIGEIKEMLRQLTQPQEMSEEAAIAAITKSVGNSLYSSEREFAALPEILQRLVSTPSQLREWAMLPSEEFQTVICSHLRRGLRTMQQREETLSKLPTETRNIIGGLANSLAMPAQKTNL